MEGYRPEWQLAVSSLIHLCDALLQGAKRPYVDFAIRRRGQLMCSSEDDITLTIFGIREEEYLPLWSHGKCF